MCAPFKGFAGNHLLTPTENDGTEQNLSPQEPLGCEKENGACFTFQALYSFPTGTSIIHLSSCNSTER